MRRKLVSQYSMLNIAPPMATAPMEAMPPRCPTMAKSTIAINGVVTLVAMDGHASAMMRRDMEPVLCCVCWIVSYLALREDMYK